jgi:hypothetical protein
MKLNFPEAKLLLPVHVPDSYFGTSPADLLSFFPIFEPFHVFLLANE